MMAVKQYAFRMQEIDASWHHYINTFVCVCWQLYMELGSVSDRLLAALQGELRPVCLSLLGSSRFRGRPRETGVLCTGRYIGMEKEDVVDVDYS